MLLIIIVLAAFSLSQNAPPAPRGTCSDAIFLTILPTTPFGQILRRKIPQKYGLDGIDLGSEDGSDAYGFLMLDGPEGSIDSSLSTTNTIIRKEAAILRIKRSLVTYNQTVIDTDEVEAGDPGKKKSNIPDWQARVKRAAKRDRGIRRRSTPVNVTVPMNPITPCCSNGNGDAATRSVDKISYIVKRANKIVSTEKSDLGVIPPAWEYTTNLFSAEWGYPGQTSSANPRMDLESTVQMDATYAYYFQSQFISPRSPDVYANLGMEPAEYIGLHLVRNAMAQYTSETVGDLLPNWEYLNNQPDPDGMDSRPNSQTSWLFRRNYTWSLVEDTADTSQWWDATGRAFVSGSYTGPAG
ncbi:hypothetical protein F4814DRAFT_456211 [Daldinia grandis]|nr:hypothetical protein F4814DRAFT_456211 [Daldinia grandis]